MNYLRRSGLRIKILAIRLRMIKLTIVSILLLVHVHMPLYANQVSIPLLLSHQSVKEAKLPRILEIIEDKTGYSFFYNSKKLNLDYTLPMIQFEDKSIEEVLDELFRDTKIQYNIRGKQILLTENKEEQSTEINGTVTDEEGMPVPGISVMEKGTSRGTVTDFDGNYAIQLGDQATLIFSGLGFATQEIAINGQTNINVQMQTDTEQLGEVVVTALGITRATKALGYSVAKVDTETLNQAANTNVSSALNGKAAGVQINNSGGGMGGTTRITIRGNKSLTGDTEPLWVVDGVPFNDGQVSNDLAQEYGGYDRAGASFDLNPENIESISVLKGASASALYGSRASNGVILVTTKSGSRNRHKLGLSYNTSVVFSEVGYLLDLQNIYGQGTGGQYGPNETGAWGPRMEGQLLESWRGEEIPYRAQPDKRKAFFDTGITQAHNIAASGSGEKTSVRASFGYNKSNDVTPSTILSKYNYGLRLTHRLTDKLTLDSKMSFNHTKGRNRPISGRYGYMAHFNTMPANIRTQDLKPGYIYDQGTGLHEEINYNGEPNVSYRNPYFIDASTKNEDQRFRNFGFASAQYQITPDLSIRGKYGLDYYREKLELINRYQSVTHPATTPDYKKTENFFRESNLEFLLNYKKKFSENFDIDLNIGANRMNQYREGLTSNSGQIDGEGNYFLGLGANVTSSNSYSEKEIQSVYGLLTIGFENYLFLDLTARNDWSSTLPKANNSYFYPSASLSFILSDALDLQSEAISMIKLRGSWAEVGKDTDPYRLVATYGIGAGQWETIYANVPTVLYNADLKSEITKSYEFGLDAQLFQNRLGLEVSYYRTNTHNQVLEVDIPQSSQYSRKIINAGNIQNSGFEAMLRTQPVKTEDFSLGVDFNFSTNTTKVIALTDDVEYYEFGSYNNGLAVRGYVGGELGDIYGNRYLRDDNGDFVLDENGLPGIDTEKTKVGNLQPDFIGAIFLNATYKTLFMRALFNMQQGGDVYSLSESQAVSAGTAKRTVNRSDVEATGVNAQEYYQRIAGATEEFMYDASYMKLGELSIGYQFSSQFLDRLTKNSIQSASLSIVGRNLFYLYNNTPGTTPDGGSFNRGLASQALDYSIVPNTRTIGLSLNASF